MIILTLRTDKPEAELGLYNDDQQLAYLTWPAHRELANSIHLKLKDVLGGQNLHLGNLQGVVAFKGPGSFTGLRIGITVANALAESFGLPIVGQMDPNWLEDGIKRLRAGQTDTQVVPEYGAEPFITPQKK